MHLYIANVAGTGVLTDRAGVAQDLDPDTWLPTEGGTVVAGDGVVWVQHTDTDPEQTVEVAAGQTYEVVPNTDNIIDIRTVTPAEEEIAASLEAGGADGDRILRAIRTAPDDHNHGDWIRGLYSLFEHRTGRNLDDVLLERLPKDQFDEAMHLLIL